MFKVIIAVFESSIRQLFILIKVVLTIVIFLIGTKNVIDACIECKVKRLIYTSSPSVVFDGVHGLHNVDETTPYPGKVLL